LTRERQPDDEVKPYEPLLGLIEPYIDGLFEKLPETLRLQFEDASFGMPNWDNLRPNNRRSLAAQHDHQTDPARAPEREYASELACQVSDVETSIEMWQSMNPQAIPSEAALKETKLAVLNRRLDNLKKLLKLPPFTIQDWDDLSDAKLAEALEKAKKSDPRHSAVPGVRESASAPGNADATDWASLAIERGWAIIQEADGRWFPTQKDLAKRIFDEFNEAKPKVVGKHGHPLEVSTIERELKRAGVSCKQARATANLNKRGN